MSFLQDYMIFASGNESPAVYHKWCALSTLSHLVSRRIWIDQGIFTIYPNMYILLVGNAGIKKSTAMSLSRSLVREIKTIPIAPPSITKEALTQFMAEKDSPCQKNFKLEKDGKPSLVQYTHLSIFSNELVTLLNAGGNAMGMVEFLTDIWDQPVFEVKTKNKGTDHIIGPYVTLLGCLTTETVTNLMNTKIISSGFARRCMLVYSNDLGIPHPRITVTPEQKVAWESCIRRGLEIQKLSGQFVWTPEADEFWSAWYVTNHERKGREDSNVRRGFLQTKPDYVLKLAALIQISESNDLVLTPHVLELAIAFIDEIEPNMDIVFAGAGRNELSPIASAIETMILASDQPIPIPRIHATFYTQAKTDEINEVLSHLATSNKIKLFSATKAARVIKFAARLDS